MPPDSDARPVETDEPDDPAVFFDGVPMHVDPDGNPIGMLAASRLWHDYTARAVARTEFDTSAGNMLVSTACVLTDPMRSNPPRVWETMFLEGPLDGRGHRVATREEAETDHKMALATLRTMLAQQDVVVTGERTYRPATDPDYFRELTKGMAKLFDPPPEFVCPVCGKASWHPDDRRNGWCGICKEQTAPPKPDEEATSDAADPGPGQPPE